MTVCERESKQSDHVVTRCIDPEFLRKRKRRLSLKLHFVTETNGPRTTFVRTGAYPSNDFCISILILSLILCCTGYVSVFRFMTIPLVTNLEACFNVFPPTIFNRDGVPTTIDFTQINMGFPLISHHIQHNPQIANNYLDC